jgi:hypothetical protein
MGKDDFGDAPGFINHDASVHSGTMGDFNRQSMPF